MKDGNKTISNNKLTEVDIKICTYHYFDDIININDLDSKIIKVN